MAMYSLVSQYEGKCRECGERYTVGDKVIYYPNAPKGRKVAHPACHKGEAPREAPAPEQPGNDNPNNGGGNDEMKEVNDMERTELFKACAEKFKGEISGKAWMRATKEEMREALKTGVIPQRIKDAPLPNRGTKGTPTPAPGEGDGDGDNEQPTPPAEPPARSPMEQIVEEIATEVATRVGAELVNEDRVTEIAQEVATRTVNEAADRLSKGGVMTDVRITVGDRPGINLDRPVHSALQEVLDWCVEKVNVYLVGEAGNGKTEIAFDVAQTFNVPFTYIPVGPTTSKADIFGYMDGHGTFHPSTFYGSFNNGGVHLWDELDKGHPGINTFLNSATSNGRCAFPNGEQVDRDDEHYTLCAANTFGKGADKRYVGSNKQDAAFLDRFVMIAVDTDEKLEEYLVSRFITEKGIRDKFLTTYRKLRGNVQERKLEIVVSMRGAIDCAKMIGKGRDAEYAIKARVLKENASRFAELAR